MAYNFKRFTSVAGKFGKTNDIIYCRRLSEDVGRAVIYFGGDLQDYEEKMMAKCSRFSRWNLDETAKLLANSFSRHDILVIKPSHFSREKFSCFNNFVTSDEVGSPTYSTALQGLEHLKELLLNCFKKLISDPANSSQLSERVFTIVGFSKGCVVLNQLLYEMYHNQNNHEIKDFIKQIKTMIWLDAGHNGEADVWITDSSILKFLAETGIEIQVHVTPYQMEDITRPWIREQKAVFVETLRTYKCKVVDKYHFVGKNTTIDLHFEILTKFAV